MVTHELGSAAGSLSLGRLVEVTDEGEAVVDFPGNELGPLAARTIVTLPAGSTRGSRRGLPVMLAFENGDRALPIIMGLVQEFICPPVTEMDLHVAAQKVPDLAVDGNKMTWTAREEIVLRCGHSSITLRKDGTIIVKGTHVVSRSSGTNKVQGATVRLN